MDRSMLARATEGTEAPTPGYLYVDLAKSASASPTTCQEMAVYLSRRLSSKNNPNIKYKCCKVMAKLCDAVPRNQFRRCLAQEPSAVSAIKEAMNFRGTPDPVRGDEPNQKVRMAAKEALDAVYREAPSSEVAAVPGTSGGAMMGGVASHGPYAGPGGHGGVATSYAPSPHAGGGGGGYGGYGNSGSAGGGRRMEGIGNPMYSDPRLDPGGGVAGNVTTEKVRNAVKEAGEVVLGMIKDPLARNVGQSQHQYPNHHHHHSHNPHGDYEYPRQGHSGNLPGYGNTSNTYAGRPPPGAAELARQTAGQWTMASNRGPAAVTGQQHSGTGNVGGSWGAAGVTASAGAVGGSWASATTSNSHYGTPSVTIQSAPGGGGGGGGGGSMSAIGAAAAASDGSYEKNLVMELCPPGGMKPVPPHDKLASFARAVPSLNSDLICPVLLDLLEDGQPWIIRAKALCVMETCIQSGGRPAEDGSGGTTNPYRDFFHACREEVAPLALHPRAAIKEPASRVLQLLGVAMPSAPPGSADGAAAAPPVAAPPAAAPAPNLLDFGNDEPTAPAPAAPPPPPATVTTNGTSNGAAPLFGGMQVKSSTTTTPQAAPTSGNLLDFAAALSESTTAQQNNEDMFALNPASAPVMNGSSSSRAAETTTDMFASMTLKQQEEKQTKQAQQQSGDEDLKSVATSGSAFGFINATTTESGTTDAGAPAGPPPPGGPAQRTTSTGSFDPLMNLTPNAVNQQRKTMQLSPEQMQAMAYQQMMMQQQYQYMQMAMAAGHQRPAPGAGGAPGGMPPMAPFMGAPGAAGARIVMAPPQGGAGAGSFFAPPKAAKKDDKKFDFVKAAMHTETKKK